MLYFKDRVQLLLTDLQDVEHFEEDYDDVTRELEEEVLFCVSKNVRFKT
ncbi:hypothetical protein [Paenibacillus sp. NPDC055715]